MSKTTFGISANVNVFKEDVALESTSENLKRFAFNKGQSVTFQKANVLEGFAAHNIDLSASVIKAIPETVHLQSLLYDAETGEVDVQIQLNFDDDFVTNKYNEIVRLDSISLSLRRLPDGEVVSDGGDI